MIERDIDIYREIERERGGEKFEERRHRLLERREKKRDREI